MLPRRRPKPSTRAPARTSTDSPNSRPRDHDAAASAPATAPHRHQVGVTAPRRPTPRSAAPSYNSAELSSSAAIRSADHGTARRLPPHRVSSTGLSSGAPRQGPLAPPSWSLAAQGQQSADLHSVRLGLSEKASPFPPSPRRHAGTGAQRRAQPRPQQRPAAALRSAADTPAGQGRCSGHRQHGPQRSTTSSPSTTSTTSDTSSVM
mmetsp:Transcript_26928/g.70844  ORF Transcript_26928/g.70844 Transcript_26928/m.70844 type:complete len:206 (+) Transcript_26928:473-1090(+)